MFHRWAALALVLAFCAVPTKQAAGQSTQQPAAGRKPAGALGQNFPNPFNPETAIPFTVDGCEGAVSQRTVTLKIYNVLAQLVAVPKLDGPAAPVDKLKLACGSYVARWDGKFQATGREAASGVYVYQFIVDGQIVAAKKMFNAK